MQYLKAFLNALPAAATSKLSFLAYALVVIAWFALAWRTWRNKNLLNHLTELPEKDRFKMLAAEMGQAWLQKGLSPEQWVRAKMQQYLLIGFLALCLSAVIVAAITVADVFGEAAVSMSLYRSQTPSGFGFHRAAYAYSRNEDAFIVTPVRGINEFELHLPEISFKILNNTRKTLYITELLFDISGNEIDRTPVLRVSYKNYDGKFSIYNDGWGKIISPRLNLTLWQGDKCSTDASGRESFMESISLQDFEESVEVSIDEKIAKNFFSCTDEIVELCVNDYCLSPDGAIEMKCLDNGMDELCRNFSGTPDKKFINKLLQKANAFTKSAKPSTVQDIQYRRRCHQIPKCVRGELRYLSENNQSMTYRFITDLDFELEKPGGGELVPSYFYDLLIEAGKRDQLVRLPLSHVLKPGEADHFVVRIATDKSAKMDMVVKAIDASQQEISRQKVSLTTFISRNEIGLAYKKEPGPDPDVNGEYTQYYQ